MDVYDAAANSHERKGDLPPNGPAGAAVPTGKGGPPPTGYSAYPGEYNQQPARDSHDAGRPKDDELSSDTSTSSHEPEHDGMMPVVRKETTRDETALRPKSKFGYALVALLCVNAAWGGFIFGYDTGTISGFINMDSFIDNFGNTNDQGQRYLSKTRSGLLVGIFSIGAAIGGAVLSKLGDLYGRKAGIYAGAAIYVVGISITISAKYPKWYQYLVGRIIGGVGVGLLSVVVPAFQSETAPQQIRGMLVSSWQLMITLGIFVGYCINYGTHHRTDESAYQISIGLGYIWCLFLVVAVVVMPESPRWLMVHDKVDEATKAMAFINRRSVDDAQLQKAVSRIYVSVQEEKAYGTGGWGELFTGKPMIPYRLGCALFILAFQQFNGVNYFLYFGSSVFKEIGQENTFASSMIFGGVNFGSTFFGLYFVDRFGRRKVLFWGSCGMCIFLIIYTVLGVRALHVNGGDTGPVRGKVGRTMVAVTNLYLFCFAASWAPAAFVIVSEIFPLRVKSKGMALGLASNWLANFLLAFFTPFIVADIHFWYGFVFAFCNLLSMVFVYFLLHESKGLSLEAIEYMYESHVLPWKSEKWVPPPKNAPELQEIKRQLTAERDVGQSSPSPDTPAFDPAQEQPAVQPVQV